MPNSVEERIGTPPIINVRSLNSSICSDEKNLSGLLLKTNCFTLPSPNQRSPFPIIESSFTFLNSKEEERSTLRSAVSSLTSNLAARMVPVAVISCAVSVCSTDKFPRTPSVEIFLM